jgi:hypothetical protein
MWLLAGYSSVRRPDRLGGGDGSAIHMVPMDWRSHRARQTNVLVLEADARRESTTDTVTVTVRVITQVLLARVDHWYGEGATAPMASARQE